MGNDHGRSPVRGTHAIGADSDLLVGLPELRGDIAEPRTGWHFGLHGILPGIYIVLNFHLDHFLNVRGRNGFGHEP